MFDAGALIFKLQTIGAQVFKQDQADAKSAVEKTGQAAQDAKPKIDELGKSTDESGKKAKSAKAPLDEQAKATEEVGEQSRKAKPKQDEQKKSAEQQAEAAKKLSIAMLAAGTAVAAMVALAVVKSTEFDSAMSNVRAATMATADEQKQLGEAALKAGGDTKYSASEAAAAEEELAKAGLSVSEVVGGSLNGALALAAAGQLQVARSAEIMATTLKQYHLEASQSSHVSDLLAAGAGKAQGSVDDLALALQYVGPVAAGLGISVEETTGALALFASQGQIGERAGTGLRGVLMSLTSPSALAAKTMKEYGVEIFDSNGKMKSLAAVSQELQGAFGGLTEAERSAALGRIFGNEQITAARVLYEGGAAAVKEWTAAVDETGYAAQQAAMRQDNLAGDVEKLGGAFDTALIRSGSAANDVLRGLVQGVTAMVDMFSEAPQPIQSTALVLGVATAAILLFGGGAVGLRVKFIELKAQLDATNVSMGRTALVGGAAGLALTGIVTIVALLAAKQAEAAQVAESYADTIDKSTGKVSRAARDVAIKELTKGGDLLSFNWQSAADAADKLGVSLDTLTDAALGNKDASAELARYYKALGGDQNELNKLMSETGMNAVELRLALEAMTNGVDRQNTAIKEGTKLTDQRSRAEGDAADATNDGADAAQTATDAYLDEAQSVDDLARKLSDLLDTIGKANQANQDAISSNIDYQDALAKVNEQITMIQEGQDGYAATLDVTTQAGRDNMSMLQELAKNAWDMSTAQLQLDGDTAGFTARLEDARGKLIAAGEAMGYSHDQAVNLANSILAIPSQKQIDVIAQTQSAQNAVDRFVYLNDGRRVTVFVDAEGGQSFRVGSTTVSPGYADGAVVRYNAAGNIYRSENHVAQIARAGDMRVWAEPETGGETYVPHALSKRGRAEAIMQETASIFGGTYIPGGAAFNADGSASASRSASGDGQVVALLERIATPDGANAVVLLLQRIAAAVESGRRDPKSDAWNAAQFL